MKFFNVFSRVFVLGAFLYTNFAFGSHSQKIIAQCVGVSKQNYFQVTISVYSNSPAYGKGAYLEAIATTRGDTVIADYQVRRNFTGSPHSFVDANPSQNNFLLFFSDSSGNTINNGFALTMNKGDMHYGSQFLTTSSVDSFICHSFEE